MNNCENVQVHIVKWFQQAIHAEIILPMSVPMHMVGTGVRAQGKYVAEYMGDNICLVSSRHDYFEAAVEHAIKSVY